MIYPAIPIHPGSVVKEEIESRNISQKNLAEALQVPYSMLNEVLNEKRPVSAELALKFEVALNINAEMLTTMQSRYNLQTARKDERIKARVFSVKQNLPLIRA